MSTTTSLTNPRDSVADAAEYASLTAQALRIETRQLARRLSAILILVIVIGLTVAGAWIASSAAVGFWFYDSGTTVPIAILSVAGANLLFGLLLTLATFRLSKDLGFPVTQSLLSRLRQVMPHE